MSSKDGVFKQGFYQKSLIFKFSFTIFIIIIYRLGLYFPVPNLLKIIGKEDTTTSTLEQTFSGLISSNFGIFKWKLIPYFLAYLLVAIILSSYRKNLQKTFHLEALQYKYTKLMTIIFASILSFIYTLVLLKTLVVPEKINIEVSITLFVAECCLFWVVGSAILLWFSDLINVYGLGNGIRIILFTDLLKEWMDSLANYFCQNSWLSNCYILIIISLISILIIYLESLEYKIPVIRSNLGVTQRLFLRVKFDLLGIFPLISTKFIVNFLQIQFKFVEYLGLLYLLIFISSSFFYKIIFLKPIFEQMPKFLKDQGFFISKNYFQLDWKNYLQRVYNNIFFLNIIYLILVTIGILCVSNIIAQIDFISLIIILKLFIMILKEVTLIITKKKEQEIYLF